MSRSDRFTELDKKGELYSDFLVNLNPHPVSRETLRYVNEYAVTRSIRNLLSTNKGEGLYQPDKGSNIRSLLFEPISESTANFITTSVTETINTFEPRAKVLEVITSSDEANNRYIVTVIYLLINKPDPVTVNITLQRVR